MHHDKTADKAAGLIRPLRALAQKGPYFILTTAACITLLWLAIPLLSHRSFKPVLLQYSLAHAMLIAAAMGVPAFIMILAVRCDRRANKKMAISCMATACIAEILARTMLPEAPLESSALRKPAPYIMFCGQPGAVVPWEPRMGALPEAPPPPLDRMGFRNEEAMTLEKPAGEFRVAVLGGSTVFNGNPLSCSIPGIMQTHFRRAGLTNAEVYNCGIVGGVSGQELALLAHVLPKYKPDLVVVYDGGNDILHPWFYDPRPGYPYNFMVLEQGMDAVSGSLTPSQVISSLLRQSKLLSILYRSALTQRSLPVDSLRRQNHYRTPAWEESVVQHYEENLNRMTAFARSIDVPICFFLQPCLALKQPVTDEEDPFLSDSDLNAYIDRQYRRAQQAYASLQNTYSSDNRAHFFDLSGIMNGYQEPTYWDMIHTDNAGNRHIAEHIVTRILSANVLDENR